MRVATILLKTSQSCLRDDQMKRLVKKLDVALTISLMAIVLVLQVPNVGAVESVQENTFNFLRDVVRIDILKCNVTQQQLSSAPTQIPDSIEQTDESPLNLYIIFIAIAVIILLAIKALAIKKRSDS